jgi:tRNA (guanine37-N1)-methyltransferase
MKSFDVIGSKDKAVAIVEIEEGENEKKVAEEIMRNNKNVKSVLKKVSGRKGKFRTREFELIAGDENTEVVHREYGYLIKVDPQKVYFSPREATERQRMAGQVKTKEKILVMFSGIAVIPIAIAKKQLDVEKIYGVELNSEAHKYAIENVRINKLSHKIKLINGDVTEVCPNLDEKFDRIIMPLPLEAEKYLELAMKCLKRQGIVHFYCFGPEEDLFSSALKAIEKNAEKIGKKIEILDKRKVSAYSPSKWKVCIDCLIK